MKLLFIILCLALSVGIQAQIYRWIDDEGNVHFGDEQSRNVQAEEISENLPKLNVSEGSDTGYVPSGESSTERNKRIREERQAEVAARKPACDKARKELKIISGPVYFTNDDGSNYTVSETERVKLEKELRAEIERYCG